MPGRAAGEAVNAAAVLALSGERDRHERRLVDAERRAYAAGYRDGRADERREDSERWRRTPLHRVNAGVTLAELELRRWGPGGRDRFGDPRPGDRFGRLAVGA
jgi:hypothetical protein